ncbi:ABC transporter transmembrane domain-containing protein [Synechococcus sp. BA-132 BA5]|uniref:ABC transporter transmembrane domain-containing protein n=1 Tax=Synechococcus sp. BA-132 BA5 TaxID=3110252 RepID=UPI002B1F761F|nr:ABC transporter transmembrane domain-containing protein [Synechococcus sp. BA-132 BA5]MEA5413654.1 ABC transporter transmembrane domain-containing protein [Synechococcus sp. BA-132 BA5]
MADPGQLLELLRSFPFLADQPPEVLDRLVTQGQLLRFSLGQPISRLEQAPPQMFFLLQGTARSVVMASRLSKGVATLQRLDPGAVMGWTALSCTRNWETILASTDLVVLALPHAALRQEMANHPPLAQRIGSSVNPSELFAVLDAHLREYPRALSHEVVEAAVALADGTRAVVLSPEQLQATTFPPERLWLVASGGLPLGTALPTSLPIADDQPLRVLGLDRPALSRLVDPAPALSSEASDGLSAAPGWEALLLDRWEDHRQQLEDGAIADAPELPLPEVEEPGDESKRSASSYPWHRGVGPLESPISAFRMLSDQLGLPFRRELLRRVFTDQVKRHGEASLALAGAVAESLGLQTQLLEISADAIGRLEAPLLVRWGNGLAVIYRSDNNGLVIGIPAVGNQELTQAEFSEQWGTEGEVLTLRVNELTPQRKFGFRWFLPALQQHRAVLVEVLLASFFVQLFGLVNPLLIQQVIDKVIINNSPSALGVLGTLLVVFAVFEGLLLCLRTFLFVDTTNRIDLALGTQIIDHLLRLPLTYFDRRPVGEVSSRIGELEKIRSFLTGTALTTILDAIFALLYIVVMVIYSWQLTLLTLAVIPVLVVLTLTVSPLVRNQIQSRAVANARAQSHLVEVLSSMMTVKAQNIELRSRWKWQDLYTDFVAEGFDNTLLSTTANTFSAFLNKLSSLLVIWGGASLVLSGDLSLGELIAFRIISGYVTGPLLRMTSIWQTVQETALSLERLSDVIDHPQEAPEDNANRIIMPPIEGKIEFQNIHFRYKNSSPLLLKGVDLTIPRGKFVAVVGTSGSGKSTLTKLVARLYNPELGSVLVDGIDISKVELYSLRRQIGIVPQDTVLFDGSVEENITLTNPEATSEEIIEAATIAAAHDFIMDLPAGYSTQVGERGSGLSGGQRQRIAIARTILQKPRMLIMDEATSALDYQTERVVSENLMQALRGCTVLFITHRLSSIVNADMIVCMGQGAVLEAGSHQELMAARGPYYVLFRQQGRSSSSSSSSGTPPIAKVGLPINYALGT